MIIRLANPCYEIECDECGEGDNDDYGGCFHHASEAAAIEGVDVVDWTIVRTEDGSVRATYCRTCWEDMTPERREEKLRA